MPQGSFLELSFENVQGVLAACRQEIGTMFGYSPENRGVGITGAVDFVDLDGTNVVLRLRGRFWHQRPTILARVEAYIKGRIPKVVDVVIEDPYQLADEANDRHASTSLITQQPAGSRQEKRISAHRECILKMQLVQFSSTSQENNQMQLFYVSFPFFFNHIHYIPPQVDSRLNITTELPFLTI